MKICSKNDRPLVVFYIEDLWRAPELLSNRETPATKETDIYSYGLIMYEIMTRDDIFGTQLSEDGMSVEGNHKFVFI